MDMKEMKAQTLAILEASQNPSDKDAVLSEMFAAGIPFGKLQALYRGAAIEGGYITDPAVVKEALESEFDSLDTDVTYESWSEFESAIDAVTENVEGASTAQVTRYFKAWCRDNEIEIPKKPKASTGSRQGGLGKVNEAMVAYANSTDSVTLTGLYEAVLPCVKGPENAKYYATSNIVLVLALKNGISGSDAVALVKEMGKIEIPADDSEADSSAEETVASEDMDEMS